MRSRRCAGKLGINRSDNALQQHRQALCRLRQARYRLKQQQREVGLRDSVAALKVELAALLSTRRALCSRMQQACVSVAAPQRVDAQTHLDVARAYLQCFRNGLSCRTLPSDATTSTLTMASTTSSNYNIADISSSVDTVRREQIQFVETHVAPDVVHGSLRGRATLLEQWQRFSTWFASFEVQPTSFALHSRAEQAICRVKAVMKMRVTPRTLHEVMPLGPRGYIVANKLLRGQPLELDVVMELRFNAHSQIECCGTSVDFVQGLRARLSSYEEVALVLSDAHISPDGQIGKDVCECPHAHLDASLPQPRPCAPSDAACACKSSSVSPSPQHSVSIPGEMSVASPCAVSRFDLAYILAPVL